MVEEHEEYTNGVKFPEGIDFIEPPHPIDYKREMLKMANDIETDAAGKERGLSLVE